MKRLPCRRLALAAFACAAMSACADLESVDTADQALTADDGALVRLVHASATSAALDVYLGDSATPAWTGVAFGASTGYLAVPAGTVALRFRNAGAAATTPPVFSADVTAADGQSVTAIAGGVLGSTAEAIKFRVTPVVEGFAPPARGTVRLRLIQGSHGLASVDVDLGDDGTVEVPALARFTSSDAAGVAVSTRSLVQVAIATGTPARRATAFTLPRSLLTAGNEVFLVLAGVPTFVPREQRGLSLVAVGHDGAQVIRQNPVLYVLPAIPDVPAIDVYAAGRGIAGGKVIDSAAFGALAAPLQLPPGSGYALLTTEASAGGVGGPLALDWTGALAAGERYLVVASGLRAADCDRPDQAVHLTVIRDGFATALTGSGRLRAIAASPDAPALDLGRFPPGEGRPFAAIAGLDNLAYDAASPEIGAEVPAEPLNPAVRVSGGDTSQRYRFTSLGNVDRAFGVIAGAFAPRAGDVGARLVIVKAVTSGAWTATALTPQ